MLNTHVIHIKTTWKRLQQKLPLQIEIFFPTKSKGMILTWEELGEPRLSLPRLALLLLLVVDREVGVLPRLLLHAPPGLLLPPPAAACCLCLGAAVGRRCSLGCGARLLTAGGAARGGRAGGADGRTVGHGGAVMAVQINNDPVSSWFCFPTKEI